ncbi:MAG: hypothetical protein HQL32_06385 [Planctomycetes bacterium]|nr:hypothetical protein [Planctomycetota bacterium]
MNNTALLLLVSLAINIGLAVDRFNQSTVIEASSQLNQESNQLDEEPSELLSNPIDKFSGKWEYSSGGSKFTREIKESVYCMLKRDDSVVWVRPCALSDENTLIVGTDLEHKLNSDGTLSIEGRYTGLKVSNEDSEVYESADLGDK